MRCYPESVSLRLVWALDWKGAEFRAEYGAPVSCVLRNEFYHSSGLEVVVVVLVALVVLVVVAAAQVAVRIARVGPHGREG